MTTKEKAALGGGTLAAYDTAITSGHSINKIDRIRAKLALPGGLNRFDAERLGDHVLPSTVAALRKRGEDIISELETIPTRYCADGVRVKRYWIVEGRQ